MAAFDLAGGVWGIPVEIDVRPLFFSKQRLRDLGWSSEAIATLPERIARGAFTFDQLLDTAEEAVRTGVVAPGYGYWPSTVHQSHVLELYRSFGGRFQDPETGRWLLDEPALARTYERVRRMSEAKLTLPNLLRARTTRLLIDRRLMRDTVAHQRVLFWRATLGDWPLWALDHLADRGGRGYLSEAVGVASLPAGIEGAAGGLEAAVFAYALATARASGRDRTDPTKRVAAACALLERTVSPEINLLHAAEYSGLSVLRPEAIAAAGTVDRRVAETAYLGEHLWFWPDEDNADAVTDAIMERLLAVLDGQLSPQAAAAAAKRRLEALP